ncbi:uncharacterized protein [Palaemon carinicauda]|uniref:uncharacterized protein n=1 Tax=Palaemon carinicauda TaxID=392227 RepID=UPI0035B5E434
MILSRFALHITYDFSKMCIISKRPLPRLRCVQLFFARAISSEMKAKLAAERQKLRDEFLEKEKEWEALVDRSLLRSEDIKIYEAHKEAVRSGRFTYDDPSTGLRVMTRLRHFYRGSCCGNACRHCVFDHENVAEQDKVQRIYNSAFWVDKDSRPDLVRMFGSIGSHQLNDEDSFRSKFRIDANTDDESIDPLFYKH